MQLKAIRDRQLIFSLSLRQAVSILQMPNLELSLWLQREIEKNPLLELPDYRGQREELQDTPSKPTLYAFLSQQIRETLLDPADQKIAEIIIGSLDEKGFFTTPFSEIEAFSDVSQEKLERGGVIPKEFIPAVEKGLRETITSGPLAGFPVVGVKTKLVFGSYHDVDSSEMAFKLAASMAFKQGFAKADPVLLEPIMKVEVVTPEEYVGDVMGDLSRRRGLLQGQDDTPSGKTINAMVPLGEMFGYATSIRSLTQGRATFTMEFDHYAEAPTNIADAIVKKG